MLLSRVRHSLQGFKLVDRGHRVLVACSGGPDSIALAHVLHRLSHTMDFKVAIASIDHGLRPEATDEVAQVDRLAQQWQCDFYPLTLRIDAKGQSLQAAARQARYEALLSLARDIGAQRIATGHTADDQAETLLMRLLRGTGVTGLTGINRHRADGVIRPLLDQRRAAIMTYIKEQALPVVSDPSNHQSRFLRVRVRKEALPLLDSLHAGVVEHLSALANDMREVDAYLDTALGTWEDSRLDVQAQSCAIDALQALPPALQSRWVQQWLGHHGLQSLSRAHLRDALAALRHPQAEVRLPQGWNILRQGSMLRLTRRVTSTQDRTSS